MIKLAAAVLVALSLAGCATLDNSPDYIKVLSVGQDGQIHEEQMRLSDGHTDDVPASLCSLCGLAH